MTFWLCDVNFVQLVEWVIKVVLITAAHTNILHIVSELCCLTVNVGKVRNSTELAVNFTSLKWFGALINVKLEGDTRDHVGTLITFISWVTISVNLEKFVPWLILVNIVTQIIIGGRAVWLQILISSTSSSYLVSPHRLPALKLIGTIPTLIVIILPKYSDYWSSFSKVFVCHKKSQDPLSCQLQSSQCDEALQFYRGKQTQI